MAPIQAPPSPVPSAIASPSLLRRAPARITARALSRNTAHAGMRVVPPETGAGLDGRGAGNAGAPPVLSDGPYRVRRSMRRERRFQSTRASVTRLTYSIGTYRSE